MISWFKTNAVSGLVLSLMLMMNVGGFLTAHMMMDDDMHNCPNMGIAALCSMSPVEHMSDWLAMFGAKGGELAVTMLLLILLFGAAWHFVEYMLAKDYANIFVPRQRYRQKVFEPLRLAFARGIIHPKVF